MDRVIAPGAVVVSAADAAPASGTPGHWTSGTPGSAQATTLPGYWVESVQEELLAVIVAGGQTPNRFNNALLLAAIQALSVGQFTHGSNSYGQWRKSPDGFIEQWGTISTNTAGAATVTLPIAHTNNTYDIKLQTGSGPANGDAVNVGTGPPTNNSFVVSSDTAAGTTPSGPVGVLWKTSGF